MTEQNLRSSDKINDIWIDHKPTYYTFDCDKGTATVEQLANGKWRWISRRVKKQRKRDGWWGITDTKEKAQQKALKELGL